MKSNYSFHFLKIFFLFNILLIFCISKLCIKFGKFIKFLNSANLFFSSAISLYIKFLTQTVDNTSLYSFVNSTLCLTLSNIQSKNIFFTKIVLSPSISLKRLFSVLLKFLLNFFQLLIVL